MQGINLTKYKYSLDKKGLDKITYMPFYTKFNFNLAHYLLDKKDLTHLTCLNCSKLTIDRLRSKKFYELMTISDKSFGNIDYWLHFHNN